jgi:hypothetical protein
VVVRSGGLSKQSDAGMLPPSLSQVASGSSTGGSVNIVEQSHELAVRLGDHDSLDLAGLHERLDEADRHAQRNNCAARPSCQTVAPRPWSTFTRTTMTAITGRR